jgi:hypothetical protein
MLGSQDKFNLVMEKLIQRLDKLNEPQKPEQKKKSMEVSAVT